MFNKINLQAKWRLDIIYKSLINRTWRPLCQASNQKLSLMIKHAHYELEMYTDSLDGYITLVEQKKNKSNNNPHFPLFK